MQLTDLFNKEIENMTNEQINKNIDKYIAHIKNLVKTTNKTNEKIYKNKLNEIIEIQDIKLEENKFIYYNEKTKKYNVKNKAINELISLKR